MSFRTAIITEFDNELAILVLWVSKLITWAFENNWVDITGKAAVVLKGYFLEETGAWKRWPVQIVLRQKGVRERFAHSNGGHLSCYSVMWHLRRVGALPHCLYCLVQIFYMERNYSYHAFHLYITLYCETKW